MLSHLLLLLLLLYPEEGGGWNPRNLSSFTPLTPPRPDLKKMLHSLRYYYRHRQSKVKGPAYQLINQSTINHVLPLQNYQYIKFFYHPWQLYFTLPLPYLDLLLPSTTHTHHPPQTYRDCSALPHTAW